MTAAGPAGPAVAAVDGAGRGILWAVLGVIAFSIQDVVIKWLSGDYPLHEVVLYRTGFGLVLTLLFIRLETGGLHLKTRRPLMHLLRGLLIVVANTAYFAALASMALAETMAIFFIAPLIITVLSVPMLGERVGWPRWLAVGVGFAGVMLIVRPAGGDFDWIALLPAVAALAYALTQLLTRPLGVTEGAGAMSFYVQLTLLAASAVVGLSIGDGRLSGGGGANVEFLVRAWVRPSLVDLGFFAASGCLVALGAYAISQAYRIAPATAVAPFEYLALPFAVLWGFLVWGDLPDAPASFGIALIVFGGLFVMHRERRARRPVAAKRPMAAIR